MSSRDRDKWSRELEKQYKELNKAEKSGALKNATSMFKSMGGVSPKAMAIGAFMEGLKPLFDLISPLLSAFSAGMQQSMVGVIKNLIPVLEEAVPLFMEIGKSIGTTLILPLQLLAPVLKILAPLLEKLTPIIQILITAGLLPFVAVIYGIAMAVAAMVDFVSGILDAIDFLNVTAIRGTNLKQGVNDFFQPIFQELMPDFSSWGFQTGTGYVPRDMMAPLHRGEVVETRDEATLRNYKEMYLQERQTAALEKLVEFKEGRY